MSIHTITDIINPYDYITIEGLDEKVKVKKLSVKEMREYERIRNEGFGTVKTNIGGMRDQTANINISKVSATQNDADIYLVKTSFTYDDEVCTDEDVENLYDLFPIVVTELKKINHINVGDEDEVSPTELENSIKK